MGGVQNVVAPDTTTSGKLRAQWSARRTILGVPRNRHHVPRRSGAGPRQVLNPRTGKAAVHPWRERLAKAVAR